MKTTKAALLYASAMLLIAVLAVFDIVPENIARYSVIAIPALVSLQVIRRGTCRGSGVCA